MVVLISETEATHTERYTQYNTKNVRAAMQWFVQGLPMQISIYHRIGLVGISMRHSDEKTITWQCIYSAGVHVLHVGICVSGRNVRQGQMKAFWWFRA